MFGSGFSLGWTISDVQTAVVGFLGLAPVIGLFVAVVALAFVPKILRAAKSAIGRR